MIRALALLLLLSAPGLAMAQPQNPSFNLANKSGQPIRQLFVTPSGDANWGQNRLSAPIAPGASFAVRRRIDGNCVFDIRVIYADSSREERRSVNTCGADDISFGPAGKPASDKAGGDPSLHVINKDKQAIAELYASPTGQPHGANLLEKGPLAPDAAITVKPPHAANCSYDLRVVFADKSVKSRTMDLCKTTELAVP
jgi:hypothetical protein